jgi:hypothetical protein
MGAALLVLPVGCAGGPNGFDSRAPLPSCGRIDARTFEGVGKPEALRCFRRARVTGRRAELVTVRYTVEGDPITSYWRNLGRRVEVWHDNTKDDFGPRDWTHYLCSSVRIVGSHVEGVGCTPMELHERVP